MAIFFRIYVSELLGTKDFKDDTIETVGMLQGTLERNSEKTTPDGFLK